MFILKYGTILNRPRSILYKINILKELLQCSLCLGFWCGVTVSGVEYLYNDQRLMYTCVLLPFASAACCWFVDNLNNVLQSIEIKLDKEVEK